jgi:hypothetical protein
MKFHNSIIWPIIMLVLGMMMVIYQSVGFDLSVMPGTLGDGRFNNYILEHGYLYLTEGNISYWNAPFFFPEKDVISYSDNLFGALPIYVVCRYWVDRETAFQLWYLILTALNFVGAYHALRKLNATAFASSIGAFIYAFSLILFIQTIHIQLLPRFAVPLAIVGFYLWLQGDKKYFYVAVLLLVYEFYCAIYLGYFLTYTIIAMLLIHVIKERKTDAVLALFKTRKDAIRSIVFLCIMMGLLGMLFYPYYLRSINTNVYSPLLIIEHSQPRIWNYFFVSDKSILWGWLSFFVKNHFVQEKFLNGENYIFIGSLPYVFVAAAFFMFRKNKTIRFFLITLLVVFILTLSIFDFSLYTYIIHLLPGARAIRVVSRYIVVALFLWSILSALFLDQFLIRSNKYIKLVMFALPVLLILDNTYFPDTNGVLKSTCQKRSMALVEKYEKERHTKPSAKAFVYFFDTDSIRDNRVRIKTAAHKQMDAMMASQVIGLPCVNGYSAKPPPDYLDCFISPNERKFRSWLNSNRVQTTVKEKYSIKDILILK